MDVPLVQEVVVKEQRFNTVRNNAMLYFYVTKGNYRKIFFFEKDIRKIKGVKETLGSYYIRLYKHLIPDEVECWEYDFKLKSHKVLVKV